MLAIAACRKPPRLAGFVEADADWPRGVTLDGGVTAYEVSATTPPPCVGTAAVQWRTQVHPQLGPVVSSVSPHLLASKPEQDWKVGGAFQTINQGLDGGLYTAPVEYWLYCSEAGPLPWSDPATSSVVLELYGDGSWRAGTSGPLAKATPLGP